MDWLTLFFVLLMIVSGLVMVLLTMFVSYECGCCGLAIKGMRMGCRCMWIGIQVTFFVGIFTFLVLSITELLLRK